MKISKTSESFVKGLLNELGVKSIRGLHVQEYGDGCSPHGERLIFVPDTRRNRKRFPSWGSNPQKTLWSQFNNG